MVLGKPRRNDIRALIGIGLRVRFPNASLTESKYVCKVVNVVCRQHTEAPGHHWKAKLVYSTLLKCSDYLMDENWTELINGDRMTARFKWSMAVAKSGHADLINTLTGAAVKYSLERNPGSTVPSSYLWGPEITLLP